MRRVNNVLLYGGSFDPIHHGHLIVARAAAEHLGASRLILIPSAVPPHKRERVLAPASDRLEMCRLATAGDTPFEVSDWELRSPGPNYTLHTVQHFRQVLGTGSPLYWLIGMDSLLELATWHRVGELASACTLVTVGRPGADCGNLSHLSGILTAEQIGTLRRHVLPTPLIGISASEIRARVRAGLSIRSLVPQAVEQYITARGLYRSA
jgi:nicotinate-nucleotide adenylyltransferase